MSDLFENRAAAKAWARKKDEERLRRGEITPSELQKENLVFRGFQKGVLGVPAKYARKPKARSNQREG
jgi:hypothetical protein